MSLINAVAAQYVTKNLDIAPKNILATLVLLYQEECTVPFIARYRKEVTGNLDEVAIRDIQKCYDDFIEIEKRQKFICETIKKLEKLTPELERKIVSTFSLSELEDIYEPFKSQRKTKATIAKDFGLEPLAIMLTNSSSSLEEMEIKLGKDYITLSQGKVPSFKEALQGACDIIIEQFAHHTEAKKKIRELYWESAVLSSIKRSKAEEIEEYLKYKDFFEFKENLNSLKNKKSSHRFLAMRRGMAQKVLKVEVEFDPIIASTTLKSFVLQNYNSLSQKELLDKCLIKAVELYIHPSLDLEIKSDLKNIADEAAIDVFGVNLKNLLLQPYLGSKAVLGIDPGQRTGCKIVVIDESGKFIGDHVIYPHPPQSKEKESSVIIQKILEQFKIEHIAIGNGTAGLDTLHFLQEHVPHVKDGISKASMINEAGASIYSASDIAREEFPDKDVTVRGAISIAKRFQDPLAELVKIDPKSIGVGQYQHDINQVKLKKSLDSVVESCVNYVGVDLNTASAPLLSHISGIGPTVAKNIVNYRMKNGQFASRKQLLKVPRFSDKIFQQAAGFLRIYQAENPLDATFIHPEKYSILEDWCKKKSINLKHMLGEQELINQLAVDHQLKKEIGEHTFDDIIKSLKSPRQDPRSEFKNTDFSKAIKTINDLKIGSWYTGIVSNITMFGAFVDIGIKENGLLHVSEMANKFVENALDHVQVGQEVKVKVLSVDMDRKRISLSCKEDSNAQAYQVSSSKKENNSPKGNSKLNQKMPADDFKNNPFAQLKNLSLGKK